MKQWWLFTTRPLDRLSRRPEEEVVESVIFVGFFLSFFVSIPLALFVVPRLFSFLKAFGFTGMVGGLMGLFCVLQTLVSVPFALRDLHSPDQLRLFFKLELIIDVGSTLGASTIVLLDEYMLNFIGLTDSDSWFFICLSLLFGFIGILVAVKKVFGESISKWYHLKPLSEGARLRQAEKYLANANTRLTKNQFEGASEEYHSAAQVYLSLEDWESSAKYFWSAAESLEKDSPSLSFGVALLYLISASAYMLSNDLEKFNDAMTLARELSKKQGSDGSGAYAAERLVFILDVLDSIKNRDTQELRQSWSNIVRKIGNDFGPYADEMVILFEKNLNVTKN